MVARTAASNGLRHIPALRPRFANAANVNLNLATTRSFSSILTKKPVHNEKVATPLGLGKMDYSTLKVPEVCVADFCLLPLGTGSPSVSTEVAEIQKLVRSSGLNFTLHSAGTTVEGPWHEVMGVIGRAHTLVHQSGAPRIQTDVRIGTRTDKKQPFADKVSKVEQILSKETQGAQ